MKKIKSLLNIDAKAFNEYDLKISELSSSIYEADFNKFETIYNQLKRQKELNIITNYTDKQGNSFLHLAIILRQTNADNQNRYENLYKIIETISKKTSLIKKTNQKKQTPFFIAVNCGDFNVSKLLFLKSDQLLPNDVSDFFFNIEKIISNEKNEARKQAKLNIYQMILDELEGRSGTVEDSNITYAVRYPQILLSSCLKEIPEPDICIIGPGTSYQLTHHSSPQIFEILYSCNTPATLTIIDKDTKVLERIGRFTSNWIEALDNHKDDLEKSFQFNHNSIAELLKTIDKEEINKAVTVGTSRLKDIEFKDKLSLKKFDLTKFSMENHLEKIFKGSSYNIIVATHILTYVNDSFCKKRIEGDTQSTLNEGLLYTQLFYSLKIGGQLILDCRTLSHFSGVKSMNDWPIEIVKTTVMNRSIFKLFFKQNQFTLNKLEHPIDSLETNEHFRETLFVITRNH